MDNGPWKIQKAAICDTACAMPYAPLSYFMFAYAPPPCRWFIPAVTIAWDTMLHKNMVVKYVKRLTRNILNNKVFDYILYRLMHVLFVRLIRMTQINSDPQCFSFLFPVK